MEEHFAIKRAWIKHFAICRHYYCYLNLYTALCLEVSGRLTSGLLCLCMCVFEGKYNLIEARCIFKMSTVFLHFYLIFLLWSLVQSCMGLFPFYPHLWQVRLRGCEWLKVAPLSSVADSGGWFTRVSGALLHQHQSAFSQAHLPAFGSVSIYFWFLCLPTPPVSMGTGHNPWPWSCLQYHVVSWEVKRYVGVTTKKRLRVASHITCAGQKHIPNIHSCWEPWLRTLNNE